MLKRLSFMFLSVLPLLMSPCCKKPDLPTEPSVPGHLKITSFSPQTGSEGTEVLITGTNFSTDLTGNTVNFDGVSAKVLNATMTQLTVTVPSGAKSGKISVKNGTHTASSTEDFIVKTIVRKYLKKISISDPGNSNVQIFWEWEYDELFRVIEARIIRQDPTPAVSSHLKFSYSGNNTKPYFIQSLPQIASENVGLDTYITYYNNGNKLKDSSIQIHQGCGKMQHIANYKYTGDIVYVAYTLNAIEPYNCIPAHVNVSNADTIYLGSNNVLEVVQNGSQNTTSKSIVSYSYDDKVNPFRQLNVFSSFYWVGFDIAARIWMSWGVPSDALYIIGLNKNNVSKIELKSENYYQQFSYVYDIDGYPLSCAITTNNGVTTYVLNVKYEYLP